MVTYAQNPMPRGAHFLSLFPNVQNWLPRCDFSARRGGNYLDLLFFGFLGFPTASLMTFCHVDFLGV